MDNDDALVGRLLSRREMLALLGGASVALVVGCSDDESSTTATSTTAPARPATSAVTQQAAAGSTAVPSCVVRPALTEGPYFVDEMLDRSDIRSDPSTGAVSEGVPLVLTFNVSTVDGSACTPLAGAMVDVWHCDALGVYSDAQDPGFNTVGQKFLRGYQVTDANGRAEFTTIYPGWYQGRTVHIHFKIRTDDGNAPAEFTSQLFFDDDLSDEVYAQAPYAQKGERTLRNDGDNIYQGSDGLLTLDAAPSADGYAATFDIGLQPA